MTIFLIFFVEGISQNMYPNPAKMPNYFNLIPHSAMTRSIYLMVSKCIDYKCYASLGDVQGELLVCLVMLYVMGVVYFLIGLFLNEPKVQNIIFNIFFKKNLSTPYLDNFLLESVKTEIDDREDSAIDYSKAINELSPSDKKFILIAKNLTKVYVKIYVNKKANKTWKKSGLKKFLPRS